MPARPPAVFVSHGAPDLVLRQSPAGDFLGHLGAALPRPDAILAVSAHWESESPRVSIAAAPETIHDFYGFPAPLYELRYDAPGAPDLAARVDALLRGAGLGGAGAEMRGLDHGAWAPLMLMHPRADVPVTQLSIQPARGPAWHFDVGRALSSLRADGVLVLATGGAVHNLRFYRKDADAVPEWARAYDDWLAATIAAGDTEALCDYRMRAPYATQAHPSDEHLLPLFVAYGAGGDGAEGRALYRGFMDGALSMAAYAFE